MVTAIILSVFATLLLTGLGTKLVRVLRRCRDGLGEARRLALPLLVRAGLLAAVVVVLSLLL